MTPAEIDRFIKAQLNMGERIAPKASRARMAAAAFTNVKGLSGPSLGDRIIAALDRPGVAPSARPVSKDGAQTFHFAFTTVSRTSDFAKKMRNDVAGKASDHMAYVEREGAAETIDTDVRRDAEAIDREAWTILGGQAYIERPDAAEVMPDGRTLASFGNIAATLDERIEFWRALEEVAPTPKTHGIITDRGKDPAFWDRVDRDPAAPATLRAVPPWIALPVHDSTPDAARLNKPISVPRVSDKEAIAVAQYAAKHRSRAKGTGLAVEIDPGRGGRIQNRLIVELPHELTPEARLKLAQAFCRKSFVEGRENPLPHWCVIHAPDHHNDARNTHMHIVFAERPASRMKHPETGEECWDFSIQVKVKDEAKHTRLKRPFEQAPDRSLKDFKWINGIRASYAKLANEALEAAGKAKRYDPRSYREMGIEIKPNKHINRKDYTKEKKGISTKAGDAVIALQWKNEEERLAERHPSFAPDPKTWDAFNREIKRWERSTTSTKFKLMILRHEWNIAQAHRKYYAAEAAANALIMRKIKSKLAPPLATDAQTARDATAYLQMFKIDLIDKHTAATKQWQKNERYLLAGLKQAQTADPKKATVSAFMDGASIMKAMAGRMDKAAVIAASNPQLTMPELVKASIAAIQESIDEIRAINDAKRVAEKAREGVVELYPSTVQAEASRTAGSAAEATATVELKTGPAPGEQTPTSTMTAPSPSTAPASLMPPPASVPRYAADGAGRIELRPEGRDPNAPPPPPPPRIGDEQSRTFLSDTGAPVQRRVYSPTRIMETVRRADAIIEAAEKRRALHAATYEAAKAAEEKFAKIKAYMDATPERRAAAAAQPAGSSEGARPSGGHQPPEMATPSTRSEPVAPVPPRSASATTTTSIVTSEPRDQTAKPTVPSATASRTRGDRAQGDSPQADHLGVLAPARHALATTDDPLPSRARAAVGTAPPTPSAPLLPEPSTVCQPSSPSTTTTTGADPSDRTQPGIKIDIADIEVDDAPPEKKRDLTPEQLRRRALLAAKDRGRGR